MKRTVYIDGFNLFYGCLRNSPYRWLNINRLCELSLPLDQINEIKYFTARVRERNDDPGKALRQKIYLRALQTLPNVTIIEGRYLTKEVSMALVNPPTGGPNTVKVWKTEEKGSDVNLAAHLLHDGHLNRYEGAVVISNDSDLVEPIRLVMQDLKLSVGVLNPQLSNPDNPSFHLQQVADFFRYIRITDIQAAQFPNTLADAKGSFYKPPKW